MCKSCAITTLIVLKDEGENDDSINHISNKSDNDRGPNSMKQKPKLYRTCSI